MHSEIVRTARERYTLRHVLSPVVLLAVVYGITRSEELFVGLALALVFGGMVTTLRETPSIDNRWIGVGGGVLVTLSSLAWFGYEYTATPDIGGPVWVPLLTALAGVWMLLDSRRDFVESRRYESGTYDDMSMSKMMLVLNHANLIVEALETGPKTVEELAEACDLTKSHVREALDITIDDGTVYRVDSEMTDTSERYALDESMVGGVAFLRTNGTRVARRLIRPLRR